jgi:hypothetical protein
MVSGFTRSKEGEAEYKKLGLTYPEELFDRLYVEDFLSNTIIEDLSKYTNHKPKEVLSIKRIKSGEEREYIVYSITEYRLDEALNVKHWFLPNIGIYPIPRPLYKTKIGPFGKQEREVSEILSVDTGYSIPFTRKNMDKIKSLGMQIEGKISYLVQLPNGILISVQSFEALRDGVFEELVHWGRIPNAKERERWLDEKGIEKDRELQQRILRQRTEGDIPQRNVTAEEVQDMINKNESKSK